jgi:hypothetical protein
LPHSEASGGIAVSWGAASFGRTLGDDHAVAHSASSAQRARDDRRSKTCTASTRVPCTRGASTRAIAFVKWCSRELAFFDELYRRRTMPL